MTLNTAHLIMPKLNLNADYLTQVKSLLRAYGSHVNGNAHDARDRDLVLRNPKNLQKPIDNLSQLKQIFIDSNLPILVNLMDWACLPDTGLSHLK